MLGVTTSPEAWKEERLVSFKALPSLPNNIYNEEVIPRDCKLGLLAKRDLFHSLDNSDIMLLSVASKVLILRSF